MVEQENLSNLWHQWISKLFDSDSPFSIKDKSKL